MTDIYTSREDLLNVNKQITEQVVAEQIVPQFVQMIKRSEERIDQISQMVNNLTDGAKELADAANKMATSSANCQHMIAELIQANSELSRTNGHITTLFNNEIKELRLELKDVNAAYRKVCERFTAKDAPSSNSSVKISL